jgi:hypothetical protein
MCQLLDFFLGQESTAMALEDLEEFVTSDLTKSMEEPTRRQRLFDGFGLGDCDL